VSASRTAEYIAFYRALESEVRGRVPLFDDPFARGLLSPTLRRAVALSRLAPLRWLIEHYADYRAPGARTSAIGRTRFIDDEVAAAVRSGCEQLVILGAGYDARAHRLAALRDVTVFEVDRRDTQDSKRSRLQRGRDDVVYVAVDFVRDDLGEALARAGWSTDRTTIFVWEGVTNYLSEPAVANVLTLVGRTAKDSRIVFTYVHRDVIDGLQSVDAVRIIRNVTRLGEPWTFGLTPADLPEFVARFGLALEQDLGANDYRARYGIASDGYAFYRVAAARVTATPTPEAPAAPAR
jgi:methyltransferase (TIGR00027 family)